MAIAGSCLCGGVRFEIDEATGPHEICHCNRCRKASGSASLAVVGVKTAHYSLVCGEDLIRQYAAPILNKGPAYLTLFCSNCGSLVPPAQPDGEWMEIPVGLFDADPGARPDKHIFAEFAPDWAPITDTLPAYTVRQLARARLGQEPAQDHKIRTHYGATLKI